MNSNNSNRFYRYAILFVLTCTAILYCLLYVRRTGYYDFPVHWRFCAYIFRGIDPYPYVGASDLPEAVKNLGAIESSFNRTPWGLVVGNVFYFGCLSFDNARYCFLILYVLFLVITSTCIYIKTEQIYPDKRFAFRSFLLASLPPNMLLLSLYVGNEGGIISCMLLLVWLFCDEHPVLTGILLALAMDKPQSALIVCFALMLQRRLVPVIIAAVIDLAAWMYASLVTGSSMMLLLKEFLSLNVGGEGFPLGIMTMFINNPSTAMYASMAAGVIFVLVLEHLYRANVLRGRSDEHNFGLCFAFMARTFWCYLRTNDCYMLLFPAIVCLYIAVTSKKVYQRVLWVIACLFMNYGSFLRSGRPLGLSPSLAVERLTTTIYELVVIAIAVMIYRTLASRQKDEVIK